MLDGGVVVTSLRYGSRRLPRLCGGENIPQGAEEEDDAQFHQTHPGSYSFYPAAINSIRGNSSNNNNSDIRQRR